jgi:uncharacterized protein YqjF (DUF2071 family)
MATSTFLTAEWRKLAMANYAVDPQVLQPYLPAGTELDLWQNTCYISLVGFMFMNTRLKGLPVPCHTNFEEVNLRFYVRHKADGAWKRGVVFISEIVPRPAITFVANRIYKEAYQTRPMAHSWKCTPDEVQVEYSWKDGVWHRFGVRAGAEATAMPEGSEAEFITEHYWGYSKAGGHVTTEYEVQHPRWLTYPVNNYEIDVDFTTVYGERFGFLSGKAPKSVLLAEGSAIAVKAGRTLELL